MTPDQLKLVGDLGGAALGGISSGLSSLIGFNSSKKMAELYNKMNIDQWNRENEYNTPKAQMERFRQAGLNPNLLVGQQNLSAQSPQLMSGQPLDMSGVPDAVRQGALLDSQINLNNANAKKALGEDNLSSSIIDLNASKEELNKLYGAKVTEETENLKKTREQIIAYTNKLVSEQKLTDLKAVEQTINNLYADDKAQKQLALWDAQIEKLGFEGQEIMTLLMARLANINADTALKGKQASEANNMAAVLYNAYSTGKIDLDFIREHPELHNFGQGAGEVLPSINALGDLLGNILPFAMPTKRVVNVLRGAAN